MSREEIQRAFTAHIRDPQGQPPPKDVEDRRMKIYRDLFFSNVQSLLAGNFPVLRKICGESGWKRMVRDFYAEHRCQTPLFPKIAREFLRYIQDERGNRESDPPFLLELAHYEWVELSLELDEREPDDEAFDPEGDLLDGVPLLSPLVRVLSYRYPVHRIGPDFQPAEPPEQATHLLVYRNPAYDVKFVQLNDVSRHLLARIMEPGSETGRCLLQEIAAALDHPEPGRVIATGAALLEDLRNRGVVLGTRRSS